MTIAGAVLTTVERITALERENDLLAERVRETERAARAAQDGYEREIASLRNDLRTTRGVLTEQNKQLAGIAPVGD